MLGSILIDPEAILKVADFLHGTDFYRAQHADIYEAMLALHSQREPIDLVTLGDELTRHDKLEGVGGPAYRHPDERGPDRGPRRALRADRRAEGGPPEPDRGRREDRGGGLRGGQRHGGGHRSGRVHPVRDQPAADGRRLRDPGHPPRPAYDRLEYLHEHRGQILGIPTGLAGLDTAGGFQPRTSSSSPRGPASGRRASRSTSRSMPPSTSRSGSPSSRSR